MKHLLKKFVFVYLALILIAGAADLDAATKKTDDKKGKQETTQRDYNQFFDLQQNTISNIDFYTTNYGIFGLDVRTGNGGGFWPRGSQNQYIFGGGIWFGAQKLRVPTDTVMKKYVEISYNPNNGRSWMVPGHIAVDESDEAQEDQQAYYRTYFSTDFTPGGVPINPDEGPNWPLWDVSNDTLDLELKFDRYFGYFIPDEEDRNVDTYESGPAFISQEDIFCVFKDTDLNYYDGGYTLRKNEGYPLRLQFEQIIYSWGFGDYRDFIFLKYEIINFSEDTLWNCWMAPVLDVDVARQRFSRDGAQNDKVRYYDEDTTLNLAFQWTLPDRGERGYNFGYLGFDFLESPSVIRVYDSSGREIVTDSTGFVRRDKRFYDNDEQLGLVTFRNWSIEDDILEDAPRYNFMASGDRDGESDAGDKRFMMATGPFNVRPKDTVRVVIGIILANAAERDETDGSTEDVAELVRKDKFAQEVYDSNFRAPEPPSDATTLYGYPLNNAVKVHWDDVAEASMDDYEMGLDFMGYRLYRSRRLDLDTFDVDYQSADLEYTRGRGPLGWKQIAQWEMPTPFYKSVHRADPDDENSIFIDSLRIAELYRDENGVLDTFKIRLMRVGKGIITYADTSKPIISFIDTGAYWQPWGPYYKTMTRSSDYVDGDQMVLYWRENFNHPLLDSVLIGTVELNSALLDYNPLYFYKETIDISRSDTANLENGDTIYFKNTYRHGFIDGQPKYLMDVLIPRPINRIMNDDEHLEDCLDSIYTYIQKGWAKVDFPDFEQSPSTIENVIKPFMDLLTNDRTFIDIGDDNGDLVIYTDEDPAKTEKLINNIDYYYKILAYDEGDFGQPTPSKLTIGNDPRQTNVTEVSPSAGRVGDLVEFEIIHVDSTKMGGLNNFKFFALNPDRVAQQFAGDTLELEILPRFEYYDISYGEAEAQEEQQFGLYRRQLVLRNITTGELLYNGLTFLETTPCVYSWNSLPTENSFSMVVPFTSKPVIDSLVTGDSITYHLPNSTEIFTRSGRFTTGEYESQGYCYGYPFYQRARGVLGFSFDFTLQQWCGTYRPDPTTQFHIPGVETPICVHDASKMEVTQIVGEQSLGMLYQPNEIPGSYNNGPIHAEVTFKEGGQETMELQWGRNNDNRNTFVVNYLDVEVRNIINFERPESPGSAETVTVDYPDMIEHLEIPFQESDNESDTYPKYELLGLNSNDMINKYNLCAHGFINGRYINKGLGFQDQYAKPVNAGRLSDPSIWNKGVAIGHQNRYYLSAISTDGKDTLDFTHTIMLAGAEFFLDFANKGRRKGTPLEWGVDSPNRPSEYNDNVAPVPLDQYHYKNDFKAGDKIVLKTFGGALGLPLPGAKVRAVVSDTKSENAAYTDDELDNIKVVPNPYYLTHQGQKSPYDSKVYFTRLPRKCTIEIYTVAGDMIRRIEHNEIESAWPDKTGVDVWDLLSMNEQRVDSQSLVALIKTPDGAQTVKKFSVVVGSFRVFGE